MLAAILVYAAVLAVAGARLGRRVRGAADFFVASRGLGAGLLFATLLAANLGRSEERRVGKECGVMW